MIINFVFLQNSLLDSKILNSGKPFVTFDMESKHFGKFNQTFEIFRKKVTSLPYNFTIEKSVSKIFLHINFLFVNRFSKFLLHILRQI